MSSLLAALQARGFRRTRARQAILAALAASSRHLKVAELHRRARELDSGVSLASVYRTMDLLGQLGLVAAIPTGHRHRHYAPCRAGHGHHLVCSGCGHVVEFTDCRIEGLARRLARRARFRIESHALEFFGRCQQCQRTERAGRSVP